MCVPACETGRYLRRISSVCACETGRYLQRMLSVCAYETGTLLVQSLNYSVNIYEWTRFQLLCDLNFSFFF